MRICRIRCKNLNSLAGEWDIDLTHAAYEEDGIFAITGPTGAGKSTILDAVCLALYGRTPRLSSVGKGGNEIMSRLTGECFAEVTFAVAEGQYRCHWYQRKARSRPDGALQDVQHEISDAHSGEVLESKTKAVTARVESITGMDFERFTRSVLLAQGGFAAFLEARPQQRAPLLERITGTDIYSRISERVHERRKAEHAALELLEAELSGMPVLDPEEEAQIRAELDEIATTAEKSKQQAVAVDRAVTWLRTVERLQKECAEHSEALRDVEQRRLDFSPEREALERAERAAALHWHYTHLHDIRKEYAENALGLAQEQAVFPACEQALSEAREFERQAGQSLADAQAKQQALLPRVRRVRELDVRIAEKSTLCRAEEESLLSREKVVQTQRASREAMEASRVRLAAQADSIVRQVAETEADAFLDEQFAALSEQCASLTESQRQLEARKQEKNTALAQQNLAQQAVQTATAKEKDAHAGLAALRDTIKGLENEDDSAVAAPVDWRETRDALIGQRSTLEKAMEAAQTWERCRVSISACEARAAPLAHEQEAIVNAIAHSEALETTGEAALEALERRFFAARDIQALEDVRKGLHDGMPCPVCGATEHPFAHGVPAPDVDDEQVRQAKQELQALRKATAEARIQQARLDKEHEQLAADMQRYTDALNEAGASLEHALKALPLHIPDITAQTLEPLLLAPCLTQNTDNAIPALTALEQANARALERVTALVRSAEQREQRLADLRRAMAERTQGMRDVERALWDARHRLAAVTDDLIRLEQDITSRTLHMEQGLARLRASLAPCGESEIQVERFPELLDALETRRARRAQACEEYRRVQQERERLERDTAHQSEMLVHAVCELEECAILLRARQGELESLRRERQDLFGAADPDAEETQCSHTVESAARELESTRMRRQHTEMELERRRSSLERLTASEAGNRARLSALEEDFQRELAAKGFVDEKAYEVACMPDDARRSLDARARALDTEYRERAARERDTRHTLTTELEKRCSDQSLEAVLTEQAGLEAEQTVLQQRLGALRQRLAEDTERKRKRGEQAQAILARRKECARWDALHALIGSADGQKYRNFAQALTFEVMISHANRQLAELSDRYILIRDPDTPLELHVMDTYQAGVARSTRNLSGGESFIVSLSLALGLARMAGDATRVDTLFLDEGFGTLDEDSLATALEALSGLRSRGTLIGVISHVPALKERISTQIRVTPGAGGKSRLSGPGCRAVEK